jgi:hypothetical protein
MGIIGLTDQGASFPFMGTIRKGGKKKKNASGKEIQGDDLTYFRLDLGENPEKEAKLSPNVLEQLNNERTLIREKWHNAFGEEPAQFTCLLLHDNPDDAFDAWLKEYNSKGLVRKCDGEKQCQWLTEKNTYSFAPKPCQKTNPQSPCKCTRTAELRVVLPDLGVMGFFKVLTHSIWDISSISQQLNMVYLSAGKLMGIPFLLKRRPRETPATTADGKRYMVTKSFLSIEVHPDVAKKVLNAIEQKAFGILEGSSNIQPTIQGTSHATPLLMPQNYSPDDQFDDDDDDILEVESTTEPKTYTHNMSLLKNAREAIKWSSEDVVAYIKPKYNVIHPDFLTPEQFAELLAYLQKIEREIATPVVETQVVPSELP